MTLHPALRSAAAGALPPWSQAAEARVGHMTRVAALLEDWGADLSLSGDDLARWRAAGFLHDALRDAEPESLRSLVAREWRDAPGEVLHGPAVAALLRREGLEDSGFLRAVEYHTLGHPELDLLGRALYVADFVEPGRKRSPEWNAELRERMPWEISAVTVDVARKRIEAALGGNRFLPPETVGFWNAILRGDDG